MSDVQNYTVKRCSLRRMEFSGLNPANNFSSNIDVMECMIPVILVYNTKNHRIYNNILGTMSKIGENNQLRNNIFWIGIIPGT